jgi:secondary thiamine-phosphate synthase enzyme
MVYVGDYGNIAQTFDHNSFPRVKEQELYLKAVNKGSGSMVFQSSFAVATRGRGTYSIRPDVERRLGDSGVQTGIVLIFVHHTSASLILCENADPDVRADLERFMGRLVPDGDPLFRHVDEGPDDMPAHVRSVLTTNSLSVPVRDGRLDLGVWQGIYLWEHRNSAHQRRVTLTVNGD